MTAADVPTPSPIGPAAGYAAQVLAVIDAEARKLRHEPTDLFTRAVQPVLWLLLFGQVMAKVRGLATVGGSYLDFLAPGILAQSVLFVSIFYGLSAIWERDLGVLHRYLVSPAPRSALVIGKALSSSIRGLAQATVVYALSAILGVRLNFAPGAGLVVILLVVLSSALFASFSLVIACIVKTRERFMGIGQLLTMPIFFASNAIYPLSLMPGWLQAVARINPLSYEVDGLRALMLHGGHSQFGLGWDFAAVAAATALFVIIATRMYPRLTQ
jgi:ABC-2 type transport system permease protein